MEETVKKLRYIMHAALQLIYPDTPITLESVRVPGTLLFYKLMVSIDDAGRRQKEDLGLGKPDSDQDTLLLLGHASACVAPPIDEAVPAE